MSFITWTQEAFGTNVTIHDQEHQEIFANLNALHAAVDSGDRAAVETATSQLLATVQSHFAAEEENLRKIDYADFAAHKAAHDELLDNCILLQKKFQAGELEITAETTEFIKNWLTAHIPQVDRAYAAPLLAAGFN